MAKRNMKATFFVYPFRAQVVGCDIADRVQTLASLGHEIGQHTHFYAGEKIEKPDKRNDLSDENTIGCLRRDFQTLTGMGLRPRGYTAGAWLVNETVWRTLVDLGFLYDCSTRFPGPNKATPTPYLHWQHAPQFYANEHGRILCLPTTCSLGEWFRWGRKVQVGNSSRYQLIYLHDYDLLTTRVYFMVWILLQTSGFARGAYDVYADQIRKQGETNEELPENRTRETGQRRSDLR
jgi:hypothetical protein